VLKEESVTVIVYLITSSILLFTAFVIFRVFIRRDYLRNGQLTPFSTFLEWLIFSSWGFFTYFDLSYSQFPSRTNSVVEIIAWILLVTGFSLTGIGMVKLGFRRSNGLEVNILKHTGFYSHTRNPQAIACLVGVIGYALLWPNMHTLGWVILFAVIVHMMVLTEEEHLLDIHSEEYTSYCKSTPRYIGLSRVLKHTVT
jgi:protein-S-isoprenylcysteine O-methyltransferase Ste14